MNKGPLYFWFVLCLEARAEIVKKKSSVFWSKPEIHFEINWPLKVGQGGHAPAILDSLAMVWYVLRKKLASNLLNSLRKLILKSFWPLSLSVCLKVYGNTGCGVFKEGIQNQKGFWLKIKISKGNIDFCKLVSKSAKIWLSKSVFYVKNHPNFSKFFFHWRIQI